MAVLLVGEGSELDEAEEGSDEDGRGWTEERRSEA
jgi:hypothetical protein